MYGPIAANAARVNAPFRFPEAIYDLASQAEWSPADGQDPGLIGFACAVRDLVRAVMRPESIDEQFGNDYLASAGASQAEVLQRIRHPRIIVSNHSLDA